MRVTNVNEKTKVIKKGEVFATCSPFILINRQDESTTAESSDVLMNKLIQWAEINDELTKICG